MFTLQQKNILQKALQAHGIEKQTDMCIEECSELTKALLKHRRAKPDEQIKASVDIVDELADVLIMAEQLSHVYGIVSVKKRIAYKIDRLQKRLKKHEQ